MSSTAGSNDTRHTFASWALRDGVGLFLLSRIMGTSIQQLDLTYGHLLGDSEDYIRGLLDAGEAVRGLNVGLVGGTNQELPANREMRMRGLEPPRGSETAGERW
jgi:hypothetical protein